MNPRTSRASVRERIWTTCLAIKAIWLPAWRDPRCNCTGLGLDHHRSCPCSVIEGVDIVRALDELRLEIRFGRKDESVFVVPCLYGSCGNNAERIDTGSGGVKFPICQACYDDRRE